MVRAARPSSLTTPNVQIRSLLFTGDHVRYAPNRLIFNTAGALRGQSEPFLYL